MYVSKTKAQTLGKYEIIKKSEEKCTKFRATINRQSNVLYKIDKTEFESKIDTLPTLAVIECD